MKSKTKIKNQVLKRLISALIVVCVVFGLDTMGKVLAGTSYPGTISPGAVFTAGTDMQANSGMTIYFCIFGDDITNRSFSGSNVSSVNTGGVAGDWSFTAPDNSEVEQWVLEGDPWYVSSAAWGGDYYATYQAEVNASVSYNPNGGTGSVITDDKIVEFQNSSTSVNVNLRGSGTFSRTGYELMGWSESATGGVDYSLSGTAPISYSGLNKTLYAVWKRNPITVDLIYGPNGGDGDYITQTKTVTLTGGSDTAEVELLSAADFTRTNYKLTGWLINEDEYGLGDSFSFHVNEGTTYDRFSFGAVWTPKSPSSISINVADNIYDNDDIASKITPHPSRTGTVTLEYKGRNQEDSAYTTTVPSSPGDYTVRATLEETDDYVSAFDTAPLTLLNSKINVGVTYKPAGGTGKEISQNKEISRKDGKWTLILLSSADFTRSGYKLTGWKDKSGKTYDLGAEYEVTKDTGDVVFEAVWTEKQKGTVDIDLKKPLYVGAEIKYDIDKNSKGDVTVEYKKKGENDEKYSKKAPTEPGKYTVRATLEETDDYTSAEDTSDFEIAYLTAPATPYTYQEVKNSAGTVTDVNVIPAEGYSISSSIDGSYGASVSYTAVKAAGGSVYLKRDSDKAITGQIELKDYKVSNTPKITVASKIYYGTEYKVTTSSLSPAKHTVEYKKAGAADSSYSATAPTEPGKYTVRLSAPATDFYAVVNITTDFSIDYLEAPSKLATLEGEKGDGKWFVSDVKIKAPSGYLICTSQNGVFDDSIYWNEKIKKIYYMRESDGAKTDAVDLEDDVYIDKHAPVISFDSFLGINSPKDSVKIYADSLSFSLSDDNLKYVTVNGKKYEFSDGKCTVLLEAGVTAEQMTVLAKDEAGNTYTLLIELVPAWMESNVMPLDRDVLLTSSVEYSFEPGKKWMVNGDATVYEGGNKFFVRSSNTYKFNTK